MKFFSKKKTVDLSETNVKRINLKTAPGAWLDVKLITIFDMEAYQPLYDIIAQATKAYENLKSSNPDDFEKLKEADKAVLTATYNVLEQTFKTSIAKHNLTLNKKPFNWTLNEIKQMPTEIVNEMSRAIQEVITPNPPASGK